MEMDEFIKQLVLQKARATAEALNQIVAHIARAPFATDPLEVDEPLWGGFWQGDVIAPGYTLPAVELALLRAIRLDQAWPETTDVKQYLADLRQIIRHPHAGIWALTLIDQACVIFAATNQEHPPPPPSHIPHPTSHIPHPTSHIPHPTSHIPYPTSHIPFTVVWYCATTGRLHAGYRTTTGRLAFGEATEQRPLKFTGKPSNEADRRSDWLERMAEQIDNESAAASLAVRLDMEILRWRGEQSNL